MPAGNNRRFEFLMNRFAEILFDNEEFKLTTSIDGNIYQLLEFDTESEVDEWDRDRLYSLINGRWNGQASSPKAAGFGGEPDSIRQRYNTDNLHSDEIPRSWMSQANSSPILSSRSALAYGSRNEAQLGLKPPSQLSPGGLNPAVNPLVRGKSSEITAERCTLAAQESPQCIPRTLQPSTAAQANTLSTQL
jgi:hypothetical protein